MGIFGPDANERLAAQLAHQQAQFDAWMADNEKRQQKLLAEQWQMINENKAKLSHAEELERVREDIIRRQLKLVEQWEQLFVRIERVVVRWETRDAG